MGEFVDEQDGRVAGEVEVEVEVELGRGELFGAGGEFGGVGAAVVSTTPMAMSRPAGILRIAVR